MAKTPTIGLAYNIDATMNQNLDRIDAALALVLPEEATEAGKTKRVQEELERQAQEQQAQQESNPEATPVEE